MAVEKNNETIVEEDKIEETEVTPEGLPVDVEVEGEEVVEERPQDDFNANLANNMDERTLKDMAMELIQEYKKDKLSRKEWEDAYIKGLDLLGTKYQEVTKPFKGASGVTHPLLAESGYTVPSTSIQRISTKRWPGTYTNRRVELHRPSNNNLKESKTT